MTAVEAEGLIVVSKSTLPQWGTPRTFSESLTDWGVTGSLKAFMEDETAR